MILNSRSTKANRSEAPEEIFLGKIPDVSRFNIFGFLVYVFDTKPGKGKSRSESRRCYDFNIDNKTKGLHCYNLGSKYAIGPKDIRFLVETSHNKLAERTNKLGLNATIIFEVVNLNRDLRSTSTTSPSQDKWALTSGASKAKFQPSLESMIFS